MTSGRASRKVIVISLAAAIAMFMLSIMGCHLGSGGKEAGDAVAPTNVANTDQTADSSEGNPPPVPSTSETDSTPRADTDTQRPLTWTDVPRDQANLEQLQAEVDAGHKPGNLDIENVAYDFCTHVLHIAGPMKLEKTETRPDGSVEAVVWTKKGRLHLLLDQPVPQDVGAIWSVRSYAWEDGE